MVELKIPVREKDFERVNRLLVNFVKNASGLPDSELLEQGVDRYDISSAELFQLKLERALEAWKQNTKVPDN